jgi:hypothetical protein
MRRDVCFTSKSVQSAVRLGGPLCAKSGLMHCNNIAELMTGIAGFSLIADVG